MHACRLRWRCYHVGKEKPELLSPPNCFVSELSNAQGLLFHHSVLVELVED